MTETEKLKKLMIIIGEMREKYISEVEAGNKEQAEKIRKVLINTMAEVKRKKELIEKEELTKSLKDTKIKTKEVEIYSMKVKGERKKKYGAIVMAILILLVTIFFALGDFSLYPLNVGPRSAKEANIMDAVIQYTLLALTVIFIIYSLNSKNGKIVTLTIIVGLVVAYFSSGNNELIKEIPKTIAENKVLNLSGGIITLIGTFFLFVKGLGYYAKKVRNEKI